VLHMVRNMVGALLEVGYGRQQPVWIKQLLANADRCQVLPQRHLMGCI